MKPAKSIYKHHRFPPKIIQARFRLLILGILSKICDRHGTPGIFESCEHVRELLEKGKISEIKTLRAFIYRMQICQECINIYDLEKYILNSKDEDKEEELPEPEYFWNEFVKAYEIMENRMSWCGKCYRELQNETDASTYPSN